MDYRYLKAFVLTAENTSFSKAAEKLKIAQSAVSRQIKLLEESLEQELIIRSSKKVLLTQKGKELYLASKNFMQTTEDLFATESKKTIKIGVLHGLLENWLQDIIVRYYSSTAMNNLEIKIDNPTALRRDMEEGKYDIIFSVDNIQSELVTSLKLFDEKLVLISKAPVQMSKIHEYRWVVFSDKDYLFQLNKKVSSQVLTVSSITSVVNLVKNNIGIAIVPDHVLGQDDDLIMTSITGGKKSKVFMTTLNYKVMPKHLEAIINLVKASIE